MGTAKKIGEQVALWSFRYYCGTTSGRYRAFFLLDHSSGERISEIREISRHHPVIVLLFLIFNLNHYVYRIFSMLQQRKYTVEEIGLPSWVGSAYTKLEKEGIFLNSTRTKSTERPVTRSRETEIPFLVLVEQAKKTFDALAKASQDIGKMRAEISANAQQVRADLQEIRATNERINAGAEEISADAQKVRADAQKIRADVKETMAILSECEDLVNDMDAQYAELGERNDRIKAGLVEYQKERAALRERNNRLEAGLVEYQSVSAACEAKKRQIKEELKEINHDLDGTFERLDEEEAMRKETEQSLNRVEPGIDVVKVELHQWLQSGRGVGEVMDVSGLRRLGIHSPRQMDSSMGHVVSQQQDTIGSTRDTMDVSEQVPQPRPFRQQ